jgi:hypothetical protein
MKNLYKKLKELESIIDFDDFFSIELNDIWEGSVNCLGRYTFGKYKKYSNIEGCKISEENNWVDIKFDNVRISLKKD